MLIALAAVVVALVVLGIGYRRMAASEDADASSRAARQRERLRHMRREEP